MGGRYLSCRRGEIYWIDWDPARGVEQRGRRPALIVQNDRGNRSSRATVVAAISSTEVAHAYPFVVPLRPGQGGLSRAGHVNCAQLLTIDKRRLVQLAGELDAETMLQVDEALRYELSL